MTREYQSIITNHYIVNDWQYLSAMCGHRVDKYGAVSRVEPEGEVLKDYGVRVRVDVPDTVVAAARLRRSKFAKDDKPPLEELLVDHINVELDY